MTGILAILGFAAVMAVINRVFRRMESAGNFDSDAPSSAARPGLRSLFDYGEDGFGRDGSRQRPFRR